MDQRWFRGGSEVAQRWFRGESWIEGHHRRRHVEHEHYTIASENIRHRRADSHRQWGSLAVEESELGGRGEGRWVGWLIDLGRNVPR